MEDAKTQPLPLPAPGAATAQLERTQPLGEAAAATSHSQAETHAHLTLHGGADNAATNSAQRYTVSTRFDASATLMKLRRPLAAPGEQTQTLGRRLLRSRDHLWIGIALVLAVVGAVAIALI